MIRVTLFGLTMILMVLSAAGKSPAPGPFKIGVLDFTSADVEGNKRFLDDQKQVLTIPAASTLNSEDRQSIHPVMQGFVRMIDAWGTVKNTDPVEVHKYHSHRNSDNHTDDSAKPITHKHKEQGK